ncbi:MAG: ATP-binding cassette domain-containing protein [Methanoregula sp.]
MLDVHIVRKLRDFTLDITLHVDDGKILVLMGENGAGKSTTLNSIAGLLSPDTGSIRLNGSVLFDAESGIDIPVEERRIGYVFQKSAVFPHMTVRENIAFGLVAQHIDERNREKRVARWLDCLDIRNLSGVRAAQLSGGQKQRVALARALATEPALLMLDEPFSGLDAGSRVSVKDAIRKCTSDLNIPCIMVTHRAEDARDIGDGSCTLCRGNITGAGSASGFSGCGCRN